MRQKMNKKFQRYFVLFLAILLQSCAGGMDRIDMGNALTANNIDAFKQIVQKIKTDPGYSEEDRSDGMYDAFLMAASRNIEATKYMLKLNTPIDYPVNQPNSTKRGMVLVSAVEANKPDIVRLLLANGADPDIELWSIDPRNNILYISFMHRDHVISKILLEAGANPNKWSSLAYPSLIAHYDGYPDIKKLLKAFGGVKNPTLEQRMGNTKNLPLLSAEPDIGKPSKVSEKTVEVRLQDIFTLKEKGLISEEEYNLARSKILSEL